LAAPLPWQYSNECGALGQQGMTLDKMPQDSAIDTLCLSTIRNTD
jgi:hypothetical protein